MHFDTVLVRSRRVAVRLLACFVPCAPVVADVIQVTPSDPLQLIINNADSGDVLLLAPGTYRGFLGVPSIGAGTASNCRADTLVGATLRTLVVCEKSIHFIADTSSPGSVVMEGSVIAYDQPPGAVVSFHGIDFVAQVGGEAQTTQNLTGLKTAAKIWAEDCTFDPGIAVNPTTPPLIDFALPAAINFLDMEAGAEVVFSRCDIVSANGTALTSATGGIRYEGAGELALYSTTISAGNGFSPVVGPGGAGAPGLEVVAFGGSQMAELGLYGTNVNGGMGGSSTNAAGGAGGAGVVVAVDAAQFATSTFVGGAGGAGLPPGAPGIGRSLPGATVDDFPAVTIYDLSIPVLVEELQSTTLTVTAQQLPGQSPAPTEGFVAAAWVAPVLSLALGSQFTGASATNFPTTNLVLADIMTNGVGSITVPTNTVNGSLVLFWQGWHEDTVNAWNPPIGISGSFGAPSMMVIHDPF